MKLQFGIIPDEHFVNLFRIVTFILGAMILVQLKRINRVIEIRLHIQREISDPFMIQVIIKDKLVILGGKWKSNTLGKMNR